MDPPFHRDEAGDEQVYGFIRGDEYVGDIGSRYLNESGEGDESLNTGGRSSGEVDAGASGEREINSSDEGEGDEGEADEVHIYI